MLARTQTHIHVVQLTRLKSKEPQLAVIHSFLREGHVNHIVRLHCTRWCDMRYRSYHACKWEGETLDCVVQVELSK